MDSQRGTVKHRLSSQKATHKLLANHYAFQSFSAQYQHLSLLGKSISWQM
jgi:hypothetical protein